MWEVTTFEPGVGWHRYKMFEEYEQAQQLVDAINTGNKHEEARLNFILFDVYPNHIAWQVDLYPDVEPRAQVWRKPTKGSIMDGLQHGNKWTFLVYAPNALEAIAKASLRRAAAIANQERMIEIVKRRHPGAYSIYGAGKYVVVTFLRKRTIVYRMRNDILYTVSREEANKQWHQLPPMD
jgi:hypothetical protein